MFSFNLQFTNKQYKLSVSIISLSRVILTSSDYQFQPFWLTITTINYSYGQHCLLIINRLRLNFDGESFKPEKEVSGEDEEVVWDDRIPENWTDQDEVFRTSSEEVGPRLILKNVTIETWQILDTIQKAG